MWLIILLFASVLSTAFWYSKAEDDKYMLKLLSLLFWGASIMIFVDNLVGYAVEGGEFIDLSAESIVLGFVLLLAVLIIWEIILLVKDPKKVVWRKHG